MIDKICNFIIEETDCNYMEAVSALDSYLCTCIYQDASLLIGLFREINNYICLNRKEYEALIGSCIEDKLLDNKKLDILLEKPNYLDSFLKLRASIHKNSYVIQRLVNYENERSFNFSG